MTITRKEPRESATLVFSFPFEVTASAIAIHSQHSGIEHEATAMRLETIKDTGSRVIAATPLDTVDSIVTFPAARSQKWKLTLKAGKSGVLVIRGIRFLNDNADIVPHMIPYPGTQSL